MSEEKKKRGFITNAVMNSLSLANRGLGDRPHKKVGTAVVVGSAAYGYFVDPVGGIVGAIAGLGIRYPDKALACANYADSVVDALLGRTKVQEDPHLKAVAKYADEAKVGKFAALVNDARERRAAGKLAKGDEAIIEAGIELGL